MSNLDDLISATDDPNTALEAAEAENETLRPVEGNDELITAQELPILTKNDTYNDDFRESANTTTGIKCEAKRLYQKTDAFGADWVEDIPDDFLVQQDIEKWAEFAILLRTHLVHGKQRLHSIVVQSPVLKVKLKQIFAGYPGINLGTKAWTVEAPFRPFIHRWDEFISACEAGDEAEPTKHLQLLQQALEPELRDTFLTISEFKAGGGLEFNQLWMIFNPGRTIFTDKRGTESAYKLLRTQVYLSEEQNQKFFLLHCCYIDYDGDKLGYALSMEAIAEYDESRTRAELGVYPLDVHEDVAAVKKRLMERGSKFEAVMGVAYRAYDGHAIDNTQQPPVKQYVKGRIVIDSASCIRFSPGSYVYLGDLDTTELVKSSDEEKAHENNPFEANIMYVNQYVELRKAISSVVKKASEVKLTDDQLLLCKHLVRGYSLKLKKWLDFSVDLIQDIRWNTRAWDSLVLSKEYKDVLMAFAKTQHTAAAQFDDIIEGKGRGMVILLEGKPGVGKTLTVESVTEEMKAPLYSISPGDLGTDAEVVQARLRDHFEIAELWNAVVLLDEADIFLEKRDINHLARNRLVSVFLQSLEYFKGTMFLTTNRVETIDHAFESRIHLTLTYSELTLESRRKVWINFIQSLQVDKSALTDDEIEKLAKVDLNGRQIKNVVKMAGLLAAHNSGRLEPEHLHTVLRIGKVY